jgi:hypothetical protein
MVAVSPTVPTIILYTQTRKLGLALASFVGYHHHGYTITVKATGKSIIPLPHR